jgi:drug/metabolite transporter (DMT)-like permease
MPSAFALLALAQLAIGAAAIFARFALAGGGPLAVSALRLLIAAVPVVMLGAWRGSYRVGDRRSDLRLGIAGTALAVHFACWIASLRSSSVAVSTLLVCTTPIWTEAVVVARARRTRGSAIGSVLCAVAGVAIVVGFPSGDQSPRGIALALAGAMAMAGYLLVVRGCDAQYDTLAIVARTYPAAGLLLLAAAVATSDRFPRFGDVGAWGAIAAMAFVSQLFGHTALNGAVRTLSATFVATVSLIEPVVAAVLAAGIFGERLTPATLVGAAVIFAAIVIAVRAEAPRCRNALD